MRREDLFAGSAAGAPRRRFAARVFGDGFELVETRLEQHRTPPQTAAAVPVLLVTADLTASFGGTESVPRGGGGELMAPILPPDEISI
jgi:hypothetical protein